MFGSNTILITGLGTGTGNFPVEKCAEQMVLALNNFNKNLKKNKKTTSWKEI